MKVTPWFPGTVKPVHPGVYQRMLNVEIVYAYFGGKNWYVSSPSYEQARINGKNADRVSAVQTSSQWRGVLK